MIIANLLGQTKLAVLNQTETDAWAASNPLDEDIIYNSDTKTFWTYDGTAGAAQDLGAPVTTWREDYTAPTGTSYMTIPSTIGHKVLLFMLSGNQAYRVVSGPATDPIEIYHNIFTGVFELYIGATPAVQFNGEWVTVIYNNDVYPV